MTSSARDRSARRTYWLAGSAVLIMIMSFALLYAVLSGQPLTTKLMDGEYSSTHASLLTKVSVVVSLAGGVLGYGGVAWATNRQPNRWMKALSTVGALALIVFVLVALWVAVVAFG